MERAEPLNRNSGAEHASPPRPDSSADAGANAVPPLTGRQDGLPGLQADGRGCGEPVAPRSKPAQLSASAARLSEPLFLRGVTLKNRLFFAPMAGYSNAAFRRLARRFGAGLTVTEMVSVKGLAYGSEHTAELLETGPEEVPAAVQLFGGDPEFFRRVLGEGMLAKFAVVDINMGCPVPKIVRNGEGSALMKDPRRAAAIVAACRKATDQVISVKFRAGFTEPTAPEFARVLEDAGAELLTVHGRTREQFYTGRADRDVIGRTAAAVRIPVLGNGDVARTEDAEDLLDRGCAGVMIGRAALADPGIFARLSGRPVDYDPVCLLEELFEGMRAVSDRYAVLSLRKFVPFFLKGKRNAAVFRAGINACETPEAVRAFLREFAGR